ncbi:MAG TPA: hypothetical protein VFV95_08740 [Vicinamibacterales bacterium]|nr:hypothetical protein [Vicinamibacterales bacterium]
MKHRHLTDDQLIAMCVAGTAASAMPQDVDGCASCESRRASLDALLRDVADVATSEADRVFTPERLARQHARILHRLEHQGQIARVIAFPHQHGQRTSIPVKPMRRWVAGAVAAAFVVGMVAGRLAHELPGLRLGEQEPSRYAAVPTAAPQQASVSASISDDDFLREIEAAVTSGPEGLRRLDRVTPVAWAQR